MIGDETRTKTKDQTLVDAVRRSPVDVYLERRRRRLGCLLLLLLALLVAAWLTWRFAFADRPVDYSSAEDHFKYGSIGSEPGGSLVDAVGGLLPPEPIFAALPRVCPDLLPGGYRSLGFVFEDGHALPIGVSRRFRLGIDQVGLNCAVCHTGTVRETPASDPMVVLGMPSHQLELQDFFRFVLDCVLDPRFTADKVLGEIEAAGYDLGPLDRTLYRLAVIPRTREQTLLLERRLRLLMGNEVTGWGHGRVDTFNPYKGLQFNWQLDRLPLSELNGASDFPSLWNQAPREGMELHWDGNNDSVDERNLSASLGAGVTPVTVDHERLGRVRDWIWTLPPPPYPFAIDEAEATRGAPLYRAYCEDCHAGIGFKDGEVTGSQVGKVVPIAEIGTDRFRLDSYTWAFSVNQYTLYPKSEYAFTHFRKTGGYANHPLDGVWARAPYLHNGAVPTLRDLLEPPEARPARFYRGYDVFDQERVGFVHDVAAAGGVRFTDFDTALDGNGNGGHLYGTELAPEDKDAIVEYMKKL